jgi:signal transduction histidine kinase
VVRLKALLEQFKAQHAASPEQKASERPADQGRNVSAKADLRDVVRGVATVWRKQKPDLDVTLDVPGGIWVDEERLVSVLDHLLQNALEAAGQEGRIALCLRGDEDGGGAIVEVSDDGPGMDQEFIDSRLFRPLATEKEAGYGLGAYQTRDMVRAMGGRLEVSSAPGEGTIMQVILPSAQGAASSAANENGGPPGNAEKP